MPSALNPRYTFPSFVVGRSNEAAYTAVSAAAVAPGTLYNPILIAGATGLGKTHLAHAVTAEALMRDGRTATLVSADELLRLIADGTRAGDPAHVERTLGGATLLVIDDMHVLDRHAAAQEILSGLIARMVADRRQVVLTSDTAEGADALGMRLAARFRNTLSATLDMPDWSHRVAILHAKARSLGVELPPSVAHHLAAQCEGSVRELEGVLTRAAAYADLERSPLTLGLARRAIPTRRNTMSPVAGAQAIQEAVAAEWGVSPDALVGAGRARMLAEPRRIAMWLCREMLSLSLREIGAAFGDRDVSTVLSALNRAAGELEGDASLATRVAHVRAILPQPDVAEETTAPSPR